MSYNPKKLNRRCRRSRPGVALMVVLFIVGTISILSLAFVIKADTELLSSQNVKLRMEMDYLGLTALNYAKSLITNPQDVTTGADGYWQGDTGLFVVDGDDYFDITVTRSVTGFTPESTFDVDCQAYKVQGGERVSQTNLQAQLRLDSSIAYWAGGTSMISANMAIFGDAYCNGDFAFNATINGDVFAGTYSGWQTGQVKNPVMTRVSWPGIDVDDYDTYYIDGTPYTPEFMDSSTYSDVDWGPSVTNPAGIYIFDSGLKLYGDNKINGTLIVTGGHLDFEDGQTTITAFKNYPAIVIDDQLHVKNTDIVITGLVQADSALVTKDAQDITITGGLFIKDAGLVVEKDYTGNIILRGDPMKASIKMISSSLVLLEWSPVGGAYYKYIRRYW